MKEDELALAVARHLLKLTPEQVAYLRKALPLGARDEWMVDALNTLELVLRMLADREDKILRTLEEQLAELERLSSSPFIDANGLRQQHETRIMATKAMIAFRMGDTVTADALRKQLLDDRTSKQESEKET